jgi:large subunit ribosomal protein L21
MEYVVLRTGGKQYKVHSGDILEIDKLITEKKSLVFEDVLLTVNGDSVKVGKPTVKGAKVSATLVEQVKGDKIRVMKFKAKSRYRKTTGFRAQLSVVQIDKIDFGAKSTKTA